jgi:phage tail sheath protein FI
MPVQTTYPGVYIEEIPSGVRTITGVATSITAFIGRALRGLTDEPVVINSFSDYERQFGGLWIDSTMSYAVQDFYLNGGSQAIIVRIVNGAGTAEIPLPADSPPDSFVTLLANSPGAWGNSLRASVDYETDDPTAPPASPVLPRELFNLYLYVRNEETGTDEKVEEYLRVSMNPDSPRYLPRVLEQNSNRISVKKDGGGNWPTTIPFVTGGNLAPTPLVTDGLPITAAEYEGNESQKTGIYALRKADLFNILCIPPPTRGADTSASVYSKAIKLCVDSRAMLIVDPPATWGSAVDTAVSRPISQLATLGVSGPDARNAALYYPLVKKMDPLRENQVDTFVPCGIVAGVMAKTDTTRGVWKSPAGIDAAMSGVQSLQVNLTDPENGQLNPLGINCLRSFPLTGRVIWGARTLRGADQLADEYKYVAVRRTALFIEETLFRGTKWVLFEPNDEPLWSQIRLNIGAFMHNLFRQGAFQGRTPREAYLVKCDKETTTQNDINLGIVNIIVGFAPLKPAEFVVIKIQQLAGQIES